MKVSPVAYRREKTKCKIEGLTGDNSFAIEGWDKKTRRPSEVFYGPPEEYLLSSQESLEGTYQQNIFKNDLANLSNGLFPMPRKDKQKTTRVVKQFPQTYSKPTTTRVYTNRPFTNQRLRADFDREIEMNRDSDIEKIRLIDEGITDVNQEVEEEQQKPKVIKIPKEKEELKDVDSDKKLLQKRYTSRPDLEKRDKSPDQVKQALGGGFMGIGKQNPTVMVTFHKREPQNLKLYLKVIQLLEKTKVTDDKPINTEVNSVIDLPANSSPQLPAVTPTKGSRRENSSHSSNRMKKSLTPTRTNVNSSMISVNRDQDDSKRGKLERSYSVKKDVILESAYASQGSPQQDPKILFKPNLPAHTPKYPAIDPSSGRTTPILTTTRPFTATACHKLYTHHPRKKSPSPSPNNPKKNQTQTSFTSITRQDTMVQRHNSAVYEGENDSMMMKPADTSSNKQIQTVVQSHEVSFKMNEEGFLPYYQQEKSFDMDLDLHPSLKTHFRSTSVTNSRGWRPKDGKPESKQVKGIKLQVYHLPLPESGLQEDTKRRKSVRKLRRKDTTEMSVEDFFRKEDEQEKKTTKRSQAPSPSPEREVRMNCINWF